MSKHQECHNSYHNVKHTNGFIDMNGVPYLLGEYLDKEGFMQIDRSAIQSDIFVDTSDAMRAVIDISIDDIGKRSGDGYLNIMGNHTKQQNLLNMISRFRDEFAHQLPVLRKGIVARINYQIEHYKTHQVIRTMVEDIIIPERSCFVDINPRNIEDNGIITNFEHSTVSTINEFTHGRDKMVLRITNVELFYQWVKNGVKGPHIKQTTVFPGSPGEMYYNQMGAYDYHNQFQHEQFIGRPDGHGCPRPEPVTPPTWNNFNRFYHFDINNQNIILHDQEIYDRNMPVGLLPCGKCRINRMFVINPGHRLIFKFTIWKNDLTIFNDTRRVSEALQVPVCYDHSYHNNMNDHDFREMLREIITEEDRKQNWAINELFREINDLRNNGRGQHHHDDHKHPGSSKIDKRLDEIEKLLHQLLNGSENPDNTDDECCCNHGSITADDIRDMIDEIKNETDENIGEENY